MSEKSVFEKLDDKFHKRHSTNTALSRVYVYGQGWMNLKSVKANDLIRKGLATKSPKP